MIDFIFSERTIENKDWATILFILCLALIAINKTVSKKRFSEFIRLFYSDKYIKVYKDGGNMLNGFTISFFIIHVVSFTFLIHFLLSYYGFSDKISLIAFIQNFTFLTVFILAKYLIDKIIATAFDIEEFGESFNLHKVSYRTYIGLLLLPITAILFYNDTPHPSIVYTLLIALLIVTLISYITSLRLYQSLIQSKLFYFILYLCTLEIAPYYFMYYWFTNSK
ncbi:MAG: DUF4271 domain-containing protein [Flavobacterium sp. MedPE-SWcel]|uniref:DUF4271 domain-containing protein n=1 Tax=uncultured Flavobacterium sp. TaxID=165435 RepID=UPI0009236086|nr:DUF4271 domain-containing protein [uncultured Flavobacterium sp.]OIQ21688.1 MAG: DUF4271 domain-containing protein [Flavobacterium sp. MedPE-SWcel]